MSEPRVRYEVTPGDPAKRDRPVRAGRAVRVVLSLDWAQVLRRQQQLLNRSEAGVLVHLFRDENGVVRIDLND